MHAEEMENSKVSISLLTVRSYPSNRLQILLVFHNHSRLLHLTTHKRSTQVLQYNYNKITQTFCCIAAVCTSAIQLQYKKKILVLQLYCSCIALVRTALLIKCAVVCTVSSYVKLIALCEDNMLIDNFFNARTLQMGDTKGIQAVADTGMGGPGAPH